MLFGPSAFQLRNKINNKKNIPKAIRNQPKNWSTSWPKFWMIFEPTWVDFGRILESKLEPSWHKVAPTPQNQSKKLLLFGRPPDRFWVDFGCQLGSPRGGCKVVVGWLSWLLGPSWRQDGPKRPQEALTSAQDSIQDRIFSRLLVF